MNWTERNEMKWNETTCTQYTQPYFPDASSMCRAAVTKPVAVTGMGLFRIAWKMKNELNWTEKKRNENELNSEMSGNSIKFILSSSPFSDHHLTIVDNFLSILFYLLVCLFLFSFSLSLFLIFIFPTGVSTTWTGSRRGTVDRSSYYRYFP